MIVKVFSSVLSMTSFHLISVVCDVEVFFFLFYCRDFISLFDFSFIYLLFPKFGPPSFALLAFFYVSYSGNRSLNLDVLMIKFLGCPLCAGLL